MGTGRGDGRVRFFGGSECKQESDRVRFQRLKGRGEVISGERMAFENEVGGIDDRVVDGGG